MIRMTVYIIKQCMHPRKKWNDLSVHVCLCRWCWKPWCCLGFVLFSLCIEHYTSSLHITSSCCSICLGTSHNHSHFHFAACSDGYDFSKTLKLDNLISIPALQVSISDTSPHIRAILSHQAHVCWSCCGFFSYKKFSFHLHSPSME